jgi:hypothetical protein
LGVETTPGVKLREIYYIPGQRFELGFELGIELGFELDSELESLAR